MSWLKTFFSFLFKDTVSEETTKFENDLKYGKKELKARNLLKSMSDEAKDVVISESISFLLDNGDILLNMTPEQKKYTMHIAYLRSVNDLDELSVKELREYRKISTNAAELGIDVAAQLHSFCEEFKATVNIILDKVVDIGVKVAATALKTSIPVLL